MKPTPLPWKVQEAENGLVPVILSTHGNGCLVAQCNPIYTDQETANANARHIARCINSHPDMLDALRGIRDGLQDYLDTMLDMGMYIHVKLFQEKMTGLPAVVHAINLAEKGEE